MVTVFLLFYINSIINSKPFNFFLGGTGKGLPTGYPLSNPASDSLSTLKRINRLTTSLIISLSRLKVLGR